MSKPPVILPTSDIETENVATVEIPKCVPMTIYELKAHEDGENRFTHLRKGGVYTIIQRMPAKTLKYKGEWIELDSTVLYFSLETLKYHERLVSDFLENFEPIQLKTNEKSI